MEKNKTEKQNVNNGQQSHGGLFNKFIQEIHNNYGLDESDVGKIFEEYYVRVESKLIEMQVSIDDNIKNNMAEIIFNSVKTALLEFDSKNIKKDSDIEEKIKENFKNLNKYLLNQILNSFAVFLNEAKSDNEGINTAIEKLRNESKYYAQCAQELCTEIKFINGWINDTKATAHEYFESGCDLLRNGDFDHAIERLDKAVSKDDSLKSQVDFYKALAECRIQMVWDFTVRREVPIIHDLDNAWLEENNYYKDAVKYETDEVKKAYYKAFCDKVKELHELYTKIDNANVNGKFDYDCFICVKQSEMSGNGETDDFKWVKEKGIIDELSKVGIRAFAAYKNLDEDLKSVKGSDNYNTAILYALQRAKVLLLVCSDNEYAQTPWVKNEYVRFMNTHKISSIVLVGNNKNVKIPKISKSIQLIELNKISQIVESVKQKVEDAKNYADSGYVYCEKCGHGYPDSIGANLSGCVQKENGVMCNGKLLSAVEYSNRRNEELQTKLRDTEKKLENEKTARERAESESEKLRNEMPVTDEVAAARYEEAQEMMRVAEQRIEQSVAVKEMLDSARSRCIALQDERSVLKAKFAFILIAVLSVALAICALVVTFYLPLQFRISFYDSWIIAVIDIMLYLLSVALLITHFVLYMSSNNTMNRSAIICIYLAGIALVCTAILSIISIWHNNTAMNIARAISLSALCCFPVMSNIIDNPRRFFAYAALIVCAFTTIAYGISKERILNDVYIYDSPKASRNLKYSVDLFDGYFYVSGIGYCTDVNIKIPSTRFGWPIKGISSFAFEGCSSLTSIEIPNSVTSIGSSAFEGCSSLTSIEIPNSVTSIESSTFEGCSNLTSIKIPNSVTNIGSSAFEGCSNLTSIEIPNSVTNIGSSAFEGCSSLTSIEIPNSVTSIRISTFYGCNNLTSITFDGNIEQWKSVYKFYDWISVSSITVHCSDGDIIEKRS